MSLEHEHAQRSGAQSSQLKAHRLLDMVVEEVSLVDRAANKHRFLVVKRDESMADKTTSPAASSEQQRNSAELVSKAIGDALGIATGALEALTNAIEQLGQAEEEGDATPIVADLAEQLSDVAGQLASAAGVELSAKADSGQVGDVVDNVRAALSRVSELLATTDAKPPATPPGPAPAPEQQPPAPTDEAGEVSKQLASVATSLRSLTDSMKDQSQRLGRLEKGVGLPNSRGAPERSTPRPETADVSWPLDLNRPMDRESVDKNVSFHG